MEKFKPFNLISSLRLGLTCLTLLLSSVPGLANPLDCSELSCGQTFSHRDLLITHYSDIHLGLKYFCIHCNKSHDTPAELREHILSNHKNIDVEECVKNQQHLNYLKAIEAIDNSKGRGHARISYPCRQCNKKFSYSHILKGHVLKMHSADTSMECEFNQQSIINGNLSEIVASQFPLTFLSPKIWSSISSGEINEIEPSPFDSKLEPFDQLPTLPGFTF